MRKTYCRQSFSLDFLKIYPLKLQHPVVIRCSATYITIVFENDKYQESTTNRSIVADKQSIWKSPHGPSINNWIHEEKKINFSIQNLCVNVL